MLLKLKPLFRQLMDKSLVHPLAGDPECQRPAVDRAACPCHRCRPAARVQAVGRSNDEETLLSQAAQMEKISG
ncbi:hypothetical protein ACWGTO_14000 [Mesorhizobium sp. PL10]